MREGAGPAFAVSSNAPCPIRGNCDSGRNKTTLNGEAGTLNLLLTIRRLFGGLRQREVTCAEVDVVTENDKKTLRRIATLDIEELILRK
jgi:hypothetical protein